MSRESDFHRHLLMRILYRKYLIEKSPTDATHIKDELLRDGKFRLDDEELGTIEDLSDMGWFAIERGEYAEARALARKTLLLGRRSADALSIMSRTSLELNDLDQADQFIRALLEQDPENVGNKLYLAELKIALGSYHEAECDLRSMYNRIISDRAHLGWFVHLLERAWTGSGIMSQPFSSEIEPSGAVGISAMRWLVLAKMELANKNKTEALRCLDQALKRESGDSLDHIN